MADILGCGHRSDVQSLTQQLVVAAALWLPLCSMHFVFAIEGALAKDHIYSFFLCPAQVVCSLVREAS